MLTRQREEAVARMAGESEEKAGLLARIATAEAAVTEVSPNLNLLLCMPITNMHFHVAHVTCSFLPSCDVTCRPRPAMLTPPPSTAGPQTTQLPPWLRRCPRVTKRCGGPFVVYGLTTMFLSGSVLRLGAGAGGEDCRAHSDGGGAVRKVGPGCAAGCRGSHLH